MGFEQRSDMISSPFYFIIIIFSHPHFNKITLDAILRKDWGGQEQKQVRGLL